MKIKKKILIISLIFALFFIFNKVNSYAQENELVSIDYQINVKSNGDMDVVETWQVSINESANIIKYFKTTEDNTLNNIQNIKLAEIVDNQEINFEESTLSNVNLSKNNCFALQASSSKMFITWNPKPENTDYDEIKIYKICYTIKDALKMYNDCAEIEWDFFDLEDAKPVEEIAGMISLDELSTKIEKTRVWGHDDLENKLTKVTDTVISFDYFGYKTVDELGFRIVTDTDINYIGRNKISKNMLDTISQEESNSIEAKKDFLSSNNSDDDYDSDYDSDYDDDYDYDYNYDDYNYDNDFDEDDKITENYEKVLGIIMTAYKAFIFVVLFAIGIGMMKVLAPLYKVGNDFKPKRRNIYNNSNFKNNNYRKKGPIYDEEINTIIKDHDDVIKDYNNSAPGYVEIILFIILIAVIAYILFFKK